MKNIITFFLFTQVLFSQSEVIFIQGLSLQLDKNKIEFFEEAQNNGFEIRDNQNGNYSLDKELDGVNYHADVRFINEKMVFASKLWGYYSISNSFEALKDYFNLLEKQEGNEQLNVIFTQRYSDIKFENYSITNSFGAYRINIVFDDKSIFITEELNKPTQN